MAEAVTSPCVGCERERLDKSLRECAECDDRIAYVRWIAAGGAEPGSGAGHPPTPRGGRPAKTSFIVSHWNPRDQAVRPETPPPSGASKRCRDCREVLPLDRFPRNQRSADGHTGRCRRCIGLHTARCYQLKRDLADTAADKRAATTDSPTRTCRRCGKLRTLDAFQRSKHCAGGREHVCNACRRDRAREVYHRNMAREGRPSVTVQDSAVASNIAAAGIASGLYLDFKSHPHILIALRAQADEQYRSPEHQALWILAQALPQTKEQTR